MSHEPWPIDISDEHCQICNDIDECITSHVGIYCHNELNCGDPGIMVGITGLRFNDSIYVSLVMSHK